MEEFVWQTDRGVQKTTSSRLNGLLSVLVLCGACTVLYVCSMSHALPGSIKRYPPNNLRPGSLSFSLSLSLFLFDTPRAFVPHSFGLSETIIWLEKYPPHTNQGSKNNFKLRQAWAFLSTETRTALCCCNLLVLLMPNLQLTSFVIWPG